MVTQQTLHLPAMIPTIPTTLIIPVTRRMAVLITTRLHHNMEALEITTPQLADQQMTNKEIMKIILWNPIILLQEVIIMEMVTRTLRLETALHIGNNMAIMVTTNMSVMQVEMGIQISIIVEMGVVPTLVQIIVKQGKVHITWGITLTAISRDSMVIMEAGNKEVCIMG